MESEWKPWEDGSIFWKVLNPEIIKRKRQSYIKCRCICGAEAEVSVADLKRGKTKSCGICSRYKDPLKASEIKAKHGLVGRLTDYRIHKTWQGIKARCECPTEKAYINYGGRGIKICEEWQDIFNFIDWAYGNGYNDDLTIERMDVNKNYCPDNCQWISLSLQSRNKRRYANNKTVVNGVSMRNGSYCANWYPTPSKMKSKRFSIHKYGEELAFFMACEYREQMMQLLTLQGVIYGQFHGT